MEAVRRTSRRWGIATLLANQKAGLGPCKNCGRELVISARAIGLTAAEINSQLAENETRLIYMTAYALKSAMPAQGGGR